MLFATMLFTGACLFAQTAPCGKSVLRPGGESTVDRFLPAPLEHVRECTLWALPAVDALPYQYSGGNHIEARPFPTLLGAQQNREFGSKGFKGGANGTFHIDLSPATQDGVAGTRLQIQFVKNKIVGVAGSGKYATPLADEVACLATLLSPVNPLTNPRGEEQSPGQSIQRQVTLNAHTPVKIALRGYLYSPLFLKDSAAKAIAMTTRQPARNITFQVLDTENVPLQVVEDVRADGIVVIRKGALAKGKITDISKSGRLGKGASFRLTVENVTATDGQEIPLEVPPLEAQASSADLDVAIGIMFWGPLGAVLTHGHEIFVRAGTTWEIPTAKEATIGTEK
jgi:hypothetical protein